jgi:hypothetical protein
MSRPEGHVAGTIPVAQAGTDLEGTMDQYRWLMMVKPF